MCTMNQFRVAAGLLALSVLTIVAPISAADDVIFAAPAAADVKSKMRQWVDGKNAKDEQLREQVDKLWVLPEGKVPARVLLEKVVQTFALVDADTRDFVAACRFVDAPLNPPKAKVLEDKKSAEFYRSNLRLFFARYLTQRKMYDEALEVFAEIDTKTVVDPAGCLFFKAVCQHQLLKKTEGLATIKQLLTSTEDVPVSYNSVATLMQYELQNLREDSLDEVARLMRDVERRLDLARGGPKVQKEEDEIVEALDKIIEKLEQQQGGGGGGSGNGQGKTNQPSSAANHSSINGTTGPGNIDKKNLRKQGGWGDLPAKEEARAKNELNRKLPPHYKQATEQYFKKIAKYRLKTRSRR
jgi:hypothetical protein